MSIQLYSMLLSLIHRVITCMHVLTRVKGLRIGTNPLSMLMAYVYMFEDYLSVITLCHPYKEAETVP